MGYRSAGSFDDRAFDHGLQARGELRLGLTLQPRVGRDTGQCLVEHATEGVHVGGGADLLAAPLLGRHVLDRSDDGGLAQNTGLAKRLGQPEIREVGAVALQEDVVRLDVAVDDPGCVRCIQGAGHLAEQLDRLAWRQRPLAHDRCFRSPPFT